MNPRPISPRESDRRRAMALREQDGFYDDSSAALDLDRKAKPERIHEGDLQPDITLKRGGGGGGGGGKRKRSNKKKGTRLCPTCHIESCEHLIKAETRGRPKKAKRKGNPTSFRLMDADRAFAIAYHGDESKYRKYIEETETERIATLRKKLTI